MRTRFFLSVGFAVVVAILSLAVAPVAGQGAAPAAKATVAPQAAKPLAPPKPAEPAKRGLVPPKPTESAKAGWTAPRTPWGDPDLQGVFTNNDESGIPLERPKNFEGRTLGDVSEAELEKLRQQRNEQAVARAPTLGGAALAGSNPVHWFENFGAQNSRPWLIVDPADGRVPPLTPEAQKRPPVRGGSSFGNGPFNGPEDFSLYDRCITRGLPGSMMPAIYGNAFQIVQGPGYVSIRYEMIHESRLIPLDGRPHLPKHLRLFMGDARGRWEGDTLVVETTNFDPRTTYRNGSENLKLIERFRAAAPDKVEWSVTVDDPATWTKPWTFAMHLSKRDDSQQPFEYACHEGNLGLANILSAARVADRTGK